jgi:hypothetical protein
MEKRWKMMKGGWIMRVEFSCRMVVLALLGCSAFSWADELQTSSCPLPEVTDYPSLPEPWSYLGCAFDVRYDDGKTQTNFFLDRIEIYPDSPGLEMVNTGHHGGTHVAVQYRDPNGRWQWRPAVYPDRATMPEYPPIADAFSGCNFLRDPDKLGAYWVTYQRSDPNGCHALWYMSPRPASTYRDQPFDGHALLTYRHDPCCPGDPISIAGIWNLPASFTLAGRSCLLTIPTGRRADELPTTTCSNYPVVLEREPNQTWADVPPNRYQHLWIQSDGQWQILRWNPLEILSCLPSPGTSPALQAQATVFTVGSRTYLLVIGGASQWGDDYCNPTSRGFIFLYRFLQGSGPGPGMDYRVELVQSIVDPHNALPGSAAMVGGYIPGALRPLPIRLTKSLQDVPSFVCGLMRRQPSDSNRWVHDFGDGPRPVAGGFVVLRGALEGGDVRLILEPVRPSDPNMGRDYLSAYGLAVLPGPDGDDVLFKTSYNGRFLVLRVSNRGGAFDLERAVVLLDENDIRPTATWETYAFSACFLGLFPSEELGGGSDLVVPFSLQQHGALDDECLRHTFICLQGVK